MKSLLVLLAVVGLVACDKVELKTEAQKTSYIVGQQIGHQPRVDPGTWRWRLLHQHDAPTPRQRGHG